jgi:fumarate reductase flavoprotein subunit
MLDQSVILLEKMPDYGGSTAMSGGAFCFTGTDVQKANGIEDSLELLEKDLLDSGHHLNDPRVVRAYVEHQYDSYRWLEKLGLVFDNVTLNGGQSAPRLHSLDPRQMLERLHDALASRGGQYRANAGVARLLTEETNKVRHVVGVELSAGGHIGAKRGVVLATGGFARSSEMIARFVPHLLNARRMGGAGSTGDGLRMAWALGADLVDMGFTKATYGTPATQPHPGKEHLAPLLVHTMYKGGIIVNRKGERFTDESTSYKMISEECLRQPDGIGIQVFGQEVMDQSAPFPIVDNYRDALEAGLIVQADSIAELADKVGVPPPALEHTVQQFNAFCDGKEPDRFGRTSLTGGYGKPPAIRGTKFYAIACANGLNSTFAGLHTDADARVLDVFGQVIPGLYAAGEVMGGFHGASYLSGSSLPKGCIFGRLAARHAATRVLS